MTKAQQALAFAREQFERSGNWMAFHNALFGIGGLTTELFPTQEARAAFVKTPEHQEIMDMLEKLQERDGWPEPKPQR